MRSSSPHDQRRRVLPFLTRLRQDRRGNALAMMAAALVPMIGITGGAIDLTRLYVVKVRLQQACDAGVLAGRKFMIDDGKTALDSNAALRANEFFQNNFRDGLFGSTGSLFTPTKTTNQRVAGVASAVVPMTLMKYFTSPAQKLTVTCEAQYDIADIDTMFVLDTTGSMSCSASASSTCVGASATYQRSDGSTGYYSVEQPDSKLQALRDSVVLFDTTVRQNADPSTNIRYGFVNYASSVNVGRIIPAAYLLSTRWTYQTRRSIGDVVGTTGDFSGKYNQADCVNGRAPSNTSWPDGTAHYLYYTNDTAYYLSNTKYSNGTCTGKVTYLTPKWRRAPYQYDIGDYAKFLEVYDPSRNDASRSKWNGCIEEAQTRADATINYTNLPDDMNPDLKPTTDAAKWKPAWPDVIWDRDGTAADDTPPDAEDSYRDPGKLGYGLAACGMPAKQIKAMSAAEVSAYVKDNDFRASGLTYHDVGMIWGTRLMSKNGVFAADNNAWAGRKPPSRSIVFMTDGQMLAYPVVYGLYGMEKLDRRVTSDGSYAQDMARHTARFRASCDYAKNRMDITVFVVALGTDLNSDLTYCASPGYAYKASSTAELKAKFREIATKVAMLRVSK